MNGEELREALRHDMEAVVPPPPLDTTAALGAARRARARRRTGWAWAGSAAMVLAVAGVATVGTAGAGIPGTAFAGAGGGSPTASGTKPHPGPSDKAKAKGEPWPTGPDGRPQQDRTARAGDRYEQGARLLNELIAVVPAGYVVPENPTKLAVNELPPRSNQAQFVGKVKGVDVWSYTSQATVTKGDRTGSVAVEVYTRGNELPAEPCALTRSFWGMQGQCQVVTVGTAKIGVVVQPTTDRRFEQWSAYRHPDGVVTFVAQGLFFAENGLEEMPFTVPQLAALATDERFHLQ